MRSFAANGARLWTLSREVRFVFSAYVLFSLLGLVTAVLYSVELSGGRGLNGLRDYYGSRAAAADDESGPGPAIELDPADRRPLVAGATYRSLLEASHFHLFTVPVLLLILSHLFVLAGVGTRVTMGGLVSAWGAALAHLAAPWIVHSLAGRGAVWMPISGAAMIGAIAALAVVTLVRMWWPPAGAA
jgi:hypothetical protein